jgi:hypothetical protein
LMHSSCDYTLLLSVQPLLLFSLSLSLPSPIIQQLSIHIVISSTCLDVMHFNIVDYHSLFLSLLSQMP